MDPLDVTESVYNFFFCLQIHHLVKRLNWKILGGDGLLTEVERIREDWWGIVNKGSNQLQIWNLSSKGNCDKLFTEIVDFASLQTSTQIIFFSD